MTACGALRGMGVLRGEVIGDIETRGAGQAVTLTGAGGKVRKAIARGKYNTPWPKSLQGGTVDTITITAGDGQTFEIPVAVAFGAGGRPVELGGDLEPWQCDHKGQTWSDCLDLRCVRCGARLFMPGRFLALRSAAELAEMHGAWVRAGWPAMSGGSWCIRSDRWTVLQHPLFAHVGGLPVRNDRLADFVEVAGRADRPQIEERPA